MAGHVGGLAATVKEDGSIVEYTKKAEEDKKKKTNSGGSMDKDAFLKLLVAQMKYQDPLEPASNTEYISQYATFSELEQMQNMSANLELARASGFVGQTVVIHTTDSNGDLIEIEGRVDYVTYENNKAMLSVNGATYPASEVYATIDPEYKTATELATAFVEALEKLPALEQVTLDNGAVIYNLMEGYNAMTTYQQNQIPKELVDKLQTYVDKVDDMNATAMAADFTKLMGELPELDELTLDDKTDVTNLAENFNDMTAFQQGYIDKGLIEKLQEYVNKISELEKAQAETA